MCGLYHRENELRFDDVGFVLDLHVELYITEQLYCHYTRTHSSDSESSNLCFITLYCVKSGDVTNTKVTVLVLIIDRTRDLSHYIKASKITTSISTLEIRQLSIYQTETIRITITFHDLTDINFIYNLKIYTEDL